MATSDTSPTGDYGAVRINGQLPLSDALTVAASGSASEDKAAAGSVDNSMASTVGSPAKLCESTETGSNGERYVRHSILGKGGFGCVYEGKDTKLGRRVAIKIDRSGCNSDVQSYLRFEEEARAAARLSHPNIVKVYDVGIGQDQLPFVVFEFIDGESLAERIETSSKAEHIRPFAREEVISLMTTVANAVHAAHKVGLVHRDLKPANILLDKSGQPHIADFGLAVDEMSQRSQKGVVAGSWFYMSPEQIRGETHFLDGRTDVWSLGVILYELLAGRRPFTGQTPAEVQDEILNREPKPLRQIDDSIPVELEKICLRCLSKQIKDRYSSALDVAKALHAYQNRSKWRLNAVVMIVTSTLLLALILSYAVVNGRPKSPFDGDTQQTAKVQPDAVETGSNTTEPIVESKPPVRLPKPGQWFPLLREAPERLIWPKNAVNSRSVYTEDAEELWVSSDQRALFKLGAVTSGEYKLQLSMFQNQWTGNAGVFIGGHTVYVDGVKCQCYQLIQLRCDYKSGRRTAALQRHILYLDESALQKSYQTLTEVWLPDLSQSDQTLKLHVENGRMTMVEWNQLAIWDLTGPHVGQFVLKPDNSYGDFGIFVDGSTTVFRVPKLLLIEEGAR